MLIGRPKGRPDVVVVVVVTVWKFQKFGFLKILDFWIFGFLNEFTMSLSPAGRPAEKSKIS